jgi:hypothetical protein
MPDTANGLSTVTAIRRGLPRMYYCTHISRGLREIIPVRLAKANNQLTQIHHLIYSAQINTHDILETAGIVSVP